MTRAEAHQILDGVKAGHFVNRQKIDEALRATGDIAPWKSAPAETQAGKRWSEYAAENIGGQR